MKRDQFTFYRSYYEALKNLPKRDRTETIMAVISYALDEEEPTLSGVPLSVFTLIRPTLDTGRRKSEIGKLGGSKKKANCKQNGSKKKANCKRGQTPSEGEGEIEKEVEVENDSYIPPYPPLGVSPDLQAAFDDWIAYKAEKRQKYKPVGLRNLQGQVLKAAKQYGDKAVAELIRECMASNWQGIIFDRLKTKDPEEDPYAKFV